MFNNTWYITILDLVKSISSALKLVSPEIERHHNQVAYISYRLAETLGLTEDETIRITLAAALHDIGAVSLEEKLDSLRFETAHITRHAELGFLLLDKFAPFKPLAKLVRYHHLAWNKGRGAAADNETVSGGSHIIHLADRAAVAIGDAGQVLSRKKDIVGFINNHCGSVFHPEYVDAFLELAQKDSFWFDCSLPSLDDVVHHILRLKTLRLNEPELLDFTRFLSRLVDFRSPLNANHSSGVAASAQFLSGLTGFSAQEQTSMYMAGYVHDLGKLAVPVHILEKAGPLDNDERGVIRSHPYFTFHILSKIPELDTIKLWASLHHERLDGQGYPFGLEGKNLPLGAQILAVADVYTALNEDRPYRSALNQAESMAIMEKMASNRAINGDLVELLHKNFAEMDWRRKKAQEISAREYRDINPLFNQPLGA